MSLPVRVLFANLSLAHSHTSRICQSKEFSDNEVRDAVKSFFIWYSNEDAGLEAVILRSPSQAVIFLSNHAVAERLLLAQNPVALSGPLSAVFSSADLVTTEMVSVQFNSDADVLERILNVVRDIQGTHEVQHTTSSISQGRGAVIKFSSPQAALKAIKPIINIQGVTRAKVIQFSDHRVLHCNWNGDLGITEATSRLSRSGFGLTSLLQHFVSLWDSQPTILTAQTLNAEKIVLVCATITDADILLAHRKIDLPFGGYLSILAFVQSKMKEKKNFDESIHSEKIVGDETKLSTTVGIPTVVESKVKSPEVFTERIDLLKLSFSCHLRNIHGWSMDAVAEDNCILVYHIETKVKIFAVTVTGPTSTAVKSRAQKLLSMLKELRGSQVIHKLPNWRPEHREALMGTAVILAVQQHLKTTVIFHFSNDGQVTAEIVSLARNGHHKMIEFLKALQPAEAVWTLPPRLLRVHDDPKLSSFRSKFAVKVDRSSKSGPKNHLKAFGFNGLLAEGYKALLGGEDTAIALSFDFIISKLNITFLDLSSEDTTDLQLNQTFPFEDLSIYNFFLYFKDEFMNFFSENFHITIDPPFEKEWNDNAQLNITLHGNSNNLNSAIAFLNTMKHSFTKESVYFPRVFEDGFKNLLDLKSNLESWLASIRDSSHPATNSTGNTTTITTATTTTTTDSSNLLHKVGFIYLTIKPPKHQRGIRRMTFPAVISITICGFSNNPAQQTLIRNVKERLSEVNSGLLYHEMELPAKSSTAKVLSKKTTCDEQADKYGLEGVHWEYHEGDAVGTVRLWAKTQPNLDNMIHAIRNGLRTKATSPTGQNVGASSNNIVTEPIAELFRLDIAWPNPTLRYVFLSESSKRELLTLVNQLEGTYGEEFRVTRSIRDKRDANLCMSLEGSMEAIQSGKEIIIGFLDNMSSQLQSVVLVMTPRQLETLKGDDLCDVKAVQAGAGVHLVLDPTSSDVSGSMALYDMRVSKRPTATTAASMSETSDDIILASAWCFNGHRVDIAIVSYNVKSPGWVWQVSCLLQVIESNEGLSPDEIALVNSGGVLVVEKDGKTMLRVRPYDTNPVFSLWGDSLDHLSLDIPRNTDPSRNLSQAIVRGLEEAERLHLVGVAVIAPVDLVSLHSTLTFDEIRKNTVDTVASFVLENHLIHLRRIVCLEVIDGTSSSYTSSDDTTNTSSCVDTNAISTSISTAEVAGNYMVQSLLRLMEIQPRLQLLRYDFPLPMNLRYSVADLEVDCAVEKKVVILGLEDGVTNAVKAVKHLVVHE